MRLQDALAALPPQEREALRTRRGIALDPRKRIDEIEQTARALVSETDIRHSRFPADARGLLGRLAAAGGTLENAADDPGATLLCELGITYRVAAGEGEGGRGKKRSRPPTASLVLPSAFLLQVPCGEGEDPRSMRVCLGFVDSELLPNLASTVTGKPLAVTGPLALQEVWEVLCTPSIFDDRIAQLPAQEARLLDGIERAGSEVTTDELMALDASPGLYRNAAGIAVPKRGAPYMLQRRGMLFTIGLDRYVLASEVSRVVGASRQRERASRRAEILATLQSDDYAPRRARYARDPSLPAAAALAMLRCWDVAMRDETGAPRGAVRKIAERLGEREDTIAMLVALSRAAGLGRLLVPDVQPPGSLLGVRVGDLGKLLRMTYRRGGAWDETRTDPEVARFGVNERALTAAPALRSIVLESLDELAKDRWVPVAAIVRYTLADPRMPGIMRIHERARRERTDAFREGLEAAVRAMITESIPAVGLADLSDDGETVRMSSRERTSNIEARPTIVQRNTLHVPGGTPLYRALALADFAEPDGIEPDAGHVLYQLGMSALARARARTLSADDVATRFAGVGIVAPLPPAAVEIISGLGAAREAGLVQVAFALVIDDPELRAEVRADPGCRRMLLEVDAGPLLLVRSDVDSARLQARLSRLGIRLQAVEPEPLRSESSASSAPPAAPVTVSRASIRRRASATPPSDDGSARSA